MRQLRTSLHSITLATLLAAGMTAGGASLALAQTSNGAKPSATPSQSSPAPSAQPGTPPAASAASLSDQDLKTFAVAALEVKKINDTYRSRYQSADTPEAKQQVQREATDKMAAAVQDKGLSVDKYNQIVRVAQTDPQVAQQIDDYAKQTK